MHLGVCYVYYWELYVTRYIHKAGPAGTSNNIRVKSPWRGKLLFVFSSFFLLFTWAMVGNDINTEWKIHHANIHKQEDPVAEQSL